MATVGNQMIPDELFGEPLELHEQREDRIHKGETLKLLVSLADATLHRPDKYRALWALTVLQRHVLTTFS